MEYPFVLDKNANMSYLRISYGDFSDIQNGSVLYLKVTPFENAGDPWLRFYLPGKQFTPEKIQLTPGAKVKRKKIICKIIKFTPGIPAEIIIPLSEKKAEMLYKNGLVIKGDGLTIEYISYSKNSNEKKGKITSEQIEDNSLAVKSYCREHNFKLPVVNITTENNIPLTRKGKKLNSIINIENCAPEFTLSGKAKIKVRGNSSSRKEIKPYKIKFKKKQNLLGLNEGKKFKTWILIRDIHSLVAFNLAEEIFKAGNYNYYSSDSVLVHIFVNGKYNGEALLCEQIEVERGRVHISEPEKKCTDIKTGYLLELQNSVANNKHPVFSILADHDYYFTDINGIKKKLKKKNITIQSEINSPEQALFIMKYLNGIYNIVYEATSNNNYLTFDDEYNLVKSPYSSSQETIESVLDTDSLVNMMILEELIRNYDFGNGSFFMAVDFSVPEGSHYHKLTFDSPWDFGWAFDSLESFPFADYDKKTGTYGKEYGEYYFAGAFQPDMKNVSFEHSNYIITMMNTQKWFREKARAVWDSIGSDKLLQIVDDSEKAFIEGGISVPKDAVDFLRWRIPYIEENLWLK